MQSANENTSESICIQVEKDDATLPLDDKQLGTFASGPTVATLSIQEEHPANLLPKYRLYKRRFVGAFGVFMLDFLGGFNVTWFGPISNNGAYTYQFH